MSEASGLRRVLRLRDLVLNGGQAPGLDFAGWNGVATGATRIGYLVASALLTVMAEVKHRRELARER